jgi:transcriptional regulator with XRE-family HTH domain
VNYQSIGKRLRSARKRLGLSQFEVAEAMGCSRAQVDNIEVARQRAPLHRIEDFSRSVGLRLILQLARRDEKTITLRTTEAVVCLVDGINDLSAEDVELVEKMIHILPRLPAPIRATLSGIILLWSERYAVPAHSEVETA